MSWGPGQRVITKWANTSKYLPPRSGNRTECTSQKPAPSSPSCPNVSGSDNAGSCSCLSSTGLYSRLLCSFPFQGCNFVQAGSWFVCMAVWSSVLGLQDSESHDLVSMDTLPPVLCCCQNATMAFLPMVKFFWTYDGLNLIHFSLLALGLDMNSCTHPSERSTQSL